MLGVLDPSHVNKYVTDPDRNDKPVTSDVYDNVLS